MLLALAAACSDSTGGDPPDTTAPALQIDAPANNSFTAAGTVTVSGTASDAEGVTRVSYQLNGAAESDVTITAGASVSFSFPVTLASGTNTIQVRAHDQAGNVTTVSLGTSLDNTPPAVSLAAPGTAATVISPTVAVQGTATDPRNVTRVTYQVNGGAETEVPVTAGPSVAFEFPVAVQTGTSAITLNVYDALGNRAQVQRSVQRLVSGIALVSLRGTGGTAITDAQITATAGGPAPQHGPARVVVYAPGGGYGIESLGNGDYRVHLPVTSTYTLQIAHPSFVPVVYNNVAVQQGSATQLEPVRMVPTGSASPGAAEIHVSNAFNGQALAGTTLRVRTGMNTTAGTPVATAVTNAQGDATFTGLAAGAYTVEMQRTGYSGGYFTATIVGGQTGQYPGSIAPVVATGQVRIILDWGISPSDLDSHLTGPTTDGAGRFHVFYAEDVYFSPAGDSVAALDYDDTSSYGPETVTIYAQSAGTYRYSVHDFSNLDLTSSTALGLSGARVRVYVGAALVRTFHVPAGVGGTLWTVFELNGTTITPINQMTYQDLPGGVTLRQQGARAGSKQP